MRGFRVRGVSVVVAAMFMLTAVACTPTGQSGQAGGGAELVNSKCTLCHSIDRIDQANKDRAGWEATVARMRAAGAVLTDAEAAQVVDYLAQRGGAK
jgi:cytochrome c5